MWIRAEDKELIDLTGGRVKVNAEGNIEARLASGEAVILFQPDSVKAAEDMMSHIGRELKVFDMAASHRQDAYWKEKMQAVKRPSP